MSSIRETTWRDPTRSRPDKIKLLYDESALAHILSRRTDARCSTEPALVEDAAEVRQHLRAAADHGAVVRGVERFDAQITHHLAAFHQVGQAAAVHELLAAHGGVVTQLLRDRLAEVFM